MKNLIPCLLIFSIFGPYVLPGFGIRTEQLVIYPLCALVIFLGQRRAGMPLSLRRASIVWTTLMASGVGVSIWFARPLTKILAGADDYLLPMAAIVVLSYCLAESRRQGKSSDTALSVCMAIQVCLVLNAGIEILEGLFPQIPPLLGWFWSGDTGGGMAVGRYALDAQRLIGIFNQPMEQGVAYGVGLFCWLHRASIRRPAPREYALLAALLLGGIIGTSKVFLFGALPVFLVCYGPSVGHSRRKTARIAGTILAIGLGFLATWYFADDLVQMWPGSARIVEVFQDDNLIAGVTAGRLNSREEGALRPLISKVYDTSPFFGIGFGGLEMVDSAYVSVYMAAGMLGLALYGITLGILLKSGIGSRAGRGSVWLAVATIVFIVGAGIGAPVLTLNRASTLMWCWIWVMVSHLACVVRTGVARDWQAIGRYSPPEPAVLYREPAHRIIR